MRRLRWEVRRLFEDGSYFVDGRFRTRLEAITEFERQKAESMGQPSYDVKTRSFSGPAHTGEHYGRFVKVMQRKKGDYTRHIGHAI